MNSFFCIETDYISPSRTIETILVSNLHFKKLFFVYNFEGISFRVFHSVLNLINFFEDDFESEICFEKEIDLDNYFAKIRLE